MTWLDTDAAARHLGGEYTPGELRRLAKAQKVPAHKPAGRWLFDPVELDQWVRGGISARRRGPLTSGKRR